VTHTHKPEHASHRGQEQRCPYICRLPKVLCGSCSSCEEFRTAWKEQCVCTCACKCVCVSVCVYVHVRMCKPFEYPVFKITAGGAQVLRQDGQNVRRFCFLSLMYTIFFHSCRRFLSLVSGGLYKKSCVHHALKLVRTPLTHPPTPRPPMQ
jgi:hypothetical protein